MKTALRRAVERLDRHLAHVFASTAREAAEHATREYFFDVYTRERLHRQEFFSNAFKALRFNGIDGDYAEFGSWGGNTFSLAYHEARRRGHPAKLWSFDSFAGLPVPQQKADTHPEWQPGRLATTVEEFHRINEENGIPRDAYRVVPGFYEDTLDAMEAHEEPTNVALAYVDCDLYSSTLAVLAFLQPRLKHGMIVAFDDYFCWTSSEISGERRAMLEIVARERRWRWAPYLQFGWHGASFVIEAAPEDESAGEMIADGRSVKAP